MNWVLARIILMVFVLASLGYDWYSGVEVPAWVAFIWAFIVFLDDVNEYVQKKLFE